MASNPIDDTSHIDSNGLNMIRRLLREKSGMVFNGVQLEILAYKLESRMKMHRMRTLSDYYFFLRYASNGKGELEELVESLTINETYFFRNPNQFEYLERKALPYVQAARSAAGMNRIRIWSAGCSSGEEPYSIAMCLTDTLANADAKWRAEIIATDINHRVLDIARRRIYGEWALRRMPEDKRRRHMLDLGDGEWAVADDLAQGVRFEQRNILSLGDKRDPADLDIIFCRNVLIYFDEADTRKIVDRFYDVLRPGGFLFLGHSESLHNITGAFDIVLEPGVVVYRKAPEQ